MNPIPRCEDKTCPRYTQPLTNGPCKPIDEQQTAQRNLEAIARKRSAFWFRYFRFLVSGSWPL